MLFTLRQYWILVGSLLFVFATIATQANVVYVSPSGSDSNSGASWAQAKATVQAAINAAFTGDQVWVKAGTYTLTAQITFNNSVALYGGFNGTETALDQRDYVHNVIILDGNNAVRVLYVPSGTTLATRIDGFTIRNGNIGNDGAGIRCDGPITAIANNIISNCAANGNYGGGIACNGVSPDILNN